MGGEGNPDNNLESEYNLTDLELKMYADLMGDLMGVLGQSWENYMNLKFEYVRTEVNPSRRTYPRPWYGGPCSC